MTHETGAGNDLPQGLINDIAKFMADKYALKKELAGIREQERQVMKKLSYYKICNIKPLFSVSYHTVYSMIRNGTIKVNHEQ